jgi:ATP-dependent RNA helicase DDX24/MAK5
MAPEAKKRKLQTAQTPSFKRPKNQPKNQPKKQSKSKPKPAPRAVVDPSSLTWESLGEEFGGLEVIRNVEVIRDGDRVQFAVADSNDTTKEATSADKTDDDAEDDSFEGFGDNDLEGQTGDSSESGAGKAGVEGEVSEEVDNGRKQKQDKKQKLEPKKAGKKQVAVQEQEDDELVSSKKGVQKSAPRSNAFDALADVDETIGEENDGPEVDVKAWAALTLSEPMLSAVSELKFEKPTKIQAEAVPKIMAGEDVVGKAETGSGKTLAFGIPMIERWLELREQPGYERKGPLAVVLSPTRELAKQLGDHMKALCNGLPGNRPYMCVVTGGLSIQKQQRQLEKADIVVGTPGRLWEVLDGDMKLQDAFTGIRFLVVDEADRIFKAGQFKEVEDILGALDKKDPEAEEDSSDEEDEEDEEEDEDEDGQAKKGRQTLVFSATFDKNLQTKLAGKGKFGGKKDDNSMEYLLKCLKFRRQPTFIDVNPTSQMASGLREGLIECGPMEKDLHLYAVMVLNPNRRTLVFTNSISAVRRLTPFLQNLSIPALPLHSQMAQKARLRSIERFTSARSTVLVATDVAARGLDIKNVEQVVHYHVPRAADTYIHRSGRTARGGSSGVSIMLCAPDEVISTRRLAGKVHAKRQRGESTKDQMIQTLPLNRTILTRLKPRVDLAKKLADAVLAKEKGHGDDTWLKNAAEDLGVEYDPEEFEGMELGHSGRGGGRKKKEKEARNLTKAEMGALRAQLRAELAQRVNLGVSEKYITGGRVNVAALLKERENATVGGLFLGGDGLGLDL